MEVQKMNESQELGSENTKGKVTSSILDAFNLLRTDKDEEKVNGGSRIIFQLQGNENAKDFNYALKRLIRSLGANVPDMRTGYFATLVTLLIRSSCVTVLQLLDFVKKELHVNNASKSEIGDVSLGQILVCGAIFRSGLMLRSTENEQKEVINLLFTASRKKSYLGSITYLILLDFINGLNDEQFTSVVWSNIKQDFKKDIKEHSLDSLYFLMIVNKQFPNKVKLRKLIGVSELLCDENILDICEKLMAGIDFNSISHPIYTEIGAQIANSPQLLKFWINGIDSQLLKHNRNRELAALNILNAILNNLNANVHMLPELLSKNFMNLFLDWFKGLQTASKVRNKRDDEDDHKIMIKKEKEVLLAFGKAMKLNTVDTTIRIETLKKLLFDPGEINLTEITGTTLVKSILSDLDTNGVKQMAKMFKGVLMNNSKKTVKADVQRSWYNNERLKAAELLSYLVCHEAVKDNTEFKLTYMRLLMCFGFFRISSDENIAISSDLSATIKLCFYRCFTSRFTNVDSLVAVLSSLCNFICSRLEKEQVRSKLEKQFPAESMECWKMLIEIAKNIENRDVKSKIDKVFLVLLYQLGLFLFSEPVHVKIARSSIKELKSCYEHYCKEKSKKIMKRKNGDLTSEPEWIEVLVEVLLSILSVESSVLRSVVQCVFRLLWEFLTPTAVGQIVSVLDPESESDPLTKENYSNDDDDDDNEESENEESENIDEKTQNSSESDSNNDDVDEDDDEEMKIPDQLRLAVQNALGGLGTESDAESLDADMIDEEEGRKLDEALAEAFKQFGHGKGKKNKKERKDKKTLSDFRIRVLDLIDIYLEKDPSMDVCLAMIAPLMRSLEFCIQDNQFRELENRIRKTIKLLTKVKKFTSTEGITTGILCDYFKATVEKGSRSHFLFQAVGDVITYFATFIIHCSQKIKHNKSSSALVDILKDIIQSYFHNRSCLLPIIFFHSILQTDWTGAYALVPIIIENIFNNEVRQYRRNEGLELVSGFYRALKRNKSTYNTSFVDLCNLETVFEKKLKEALQNDSNFEVKKNFIVALKKLINTIKMVHEGCHIESNLNYQSLLEIVSSYKVKIKGVVCTQSVQKSTSKPKKNKKSKKRPNEVNGHIEPNIKRKRKDSHKSE
ncbi:hypothetical protein ACJJTC_006078 [Scirpophaga incertulas]